MKRHRNAIILCSINWISYAVSSFCVTFLTFVFDADFVSLKDIFFLKIMIYLIRNLFQQFLSYYTLFTKDNMLEK